MCPFPSCMCSLNCSSICHFCLFSTCILLSHFFCNCHVCLFQICMFQIHFCLHCFSICSRCKHPRTSAIRQHTYMYNIYIFWSLHPSIHPSAFPWADPILHSLSCCRRSAAGNQWPVSSCFGADRPRWGLWSRPHGSTAGDCRLQDAPMRLWTIYEQYGCKWLDQKQRWFQAGIPRNSSWGFVMLKCCELFGFSCFKSSSAQSW